MLDTLRDTDIGSPAERIPRGLGGSFALLFTQSSCCCWVLLLPGVGRPVWAALKTPDSHQHFTLRKMLPIPSGSGSLADITSTTPQRFLLPEGHASLPPKALLFFSTGHLSFRPSRTQRFIQPVSGEALFIPRPVKPMGVCYFNTRQDSCVLLQSNVTTNAGRRPQKNA